MIRVYRKLGSDSTMLDYRKFDKSVEAEDYYSELCKIRTDGPGVVKLNSNIDWITGGHFRTDKDWTLEREQDLDRIKRDSEYNEPDPDDIEEIAFIETTGHASNE
tara:strand:+ start:875 stop:1189 length:315 start_codon:yes stop_codon:yes gene_type:complete